MQLKKIILFFGFIFFPNIYCAGAGLWTTTLNNGLRIILQEDHSTGLTASVLCVRAGSRTESELNNGLSHLLEHLLFDGTTHRSREQLSKEVNRVGGYFNAFTRKDYVCYEMVMPTEHVQTGLELQADQVLNSAIPPKELSKERQVVCEEIAKDLDSSQSAADDRLMMLLFGKSGYGLPVIGNYQTVESIPRKAILRFYRSRYVPNRMTLVVVGDIQPDTILESIKNLYGETKEGLTPAGIDSKPNFPKTDTSHVYTVPATMEYILTALPAPPITNTESLDLEVAIQMWAAGESSFLNKALVSCDPPLASSAHAWISHYDGYSLLQIGVLPTNNPKIQAQETDYIIQSKIRESLQQFLTEGIQSGKLCRTLTTLEVDHEFSKEKYHHLAREIAHYDALNARDSFVNYEEQLNQITLDDIRVAVENLIADNFLSVHIIPSETGETVDTESNIKNEPQLKTLENGMKIIAWSDPHAPLAAIHLLIPVLDSDFQAGMPRIVSELLDKGTETQSMETLENTMAEHGIRIKLADNPWMPFDNYYNSAEYTYIRMECLASEINTALELLNDMAFNSVLPEKEFNKNKKKLLVLSKRQSVRPSDLTLDALGNIVFPDSIYSKQMIPPPAELMALKLEQAKQYYHSTYQPGRCILSIVGKVSPADIFKESTELFNTETKSEFKSFSLPDPSTTPQQISINVSSEQAYIRGGFPITVSSEQIPVLYVIAEILSNQMKLSIREKKGMAYRLGSHFSVKKGCSSFQVSVGTRTKNVQEVEHDLKQLLDQFRKKTFRSEEIDSVVNSLIGHIQRYRQRRINRAYFLGWREYLGYGYMSDLQICDQLKVVTPDKIHTALRNLIPPSEKWFWVIASSTDDNINQ